MDDTFNPPPSASLSDVNHLRHRQTVPDVPDDIQDQLLEHFNDPNWDFNANSSTISISTDTDDLEPKRWSKSIGASSEMDTELQDSKADFSSETTQFQSVLLPRPFYCA